jgi:hypothetical protein
LTGLAHIRSDPSSQQRNQRKAAHNARSIAHCRGRMLTQHDIDDIVGRSSSSSITTRPRRMLTAHGSERAAIVERRSSSGDRKLLAQAPTAAISARR